MCRRQNCVIGGKCTAFRHYLPFVHPFYTTQPHNLRQNDKNPRKRRTNSGIRGPRGLLAQRIESAPCPPSGNAQEGTGGTTHVREIFRINLPVPLEVHIVSWVTEKHYEEHVVKYVEVLRSFSGTRENGGWR